MSDQEMMPIDILWRDDGHVSDVAVDALADGQEAIVARPVRDHVNECELCAGRFGEAVLLAMQVGEVMQQSLRAAKVQPWPVPMPALIAALLVAALGALPAVGDLLVRATDLFRGVGAILPNLTRAALVLSRSGETGPALAYLSLGAVAILLAGGLLVARALPRDAPSQGGAR
jgi:hypothetical protein